MTKKRILLSAIAALTLYAKGDYAFAQKGLTSEERKIYDRALTLAKKTNNSQAIGLLRGIYEKHPDNIDIAYNLGLCYLNMSGNPDSTLFFLQKTRALDTNRHWSVSRVELMLAIARAQQLCHKPDDALKTYDEITANVKDTTYASIIEGERRICNNAKVLIAQPVKLELHRIGDSVNSEFNDYRPVLTAGEDTMYFTSRRYKPDANKRIIFDDGQYEEGVYTSVRNGDKWSGKWSEAKQVKGLVLDKNGLAGQETATSICQDELYLCHDGDIYVSKRNAKGEWEPAKALPSPVNTSFEESAAFVTADGQDLYFSSNCPGGYGGKDIYVSHRLPNGDWAEPLNLGMGVNTEEDEDSPFYHEQSEVLYFSSRGHNTMGGYDIFFSPKCDKGCFEAVQNIGYPINSADDDLYFAPSQDRDKAYYSSIRWNSATTASGFDIYEVEFEQPEQNRMALIASIIEAPRLDNVRILTQKGGKTIAICYPNNRTGRFVSIVESKGDYEIIAISGQDTLRQSVSLTMADSYHNRKEPIDLQPYTFSQQLLANAAAEEEANMNAAANSLSAANGQNGNKVNGSANSAKNDATASGMPQNGKGEGEWNSWITTEKRPYTVQIFALRKPCDPKVLKKLEIDSIAQYVYRDGWYVYSYGAYGTYSDALKIQKRIRATTPYGDAFSRNSKQYLKYIKKETDAKIENENENEGSLKSKKD